ncbi:MAG: pimeloyl-ACP methyl ester carboxylesterase [Kiritimatiellia bacterium]
MSAVFWFASGALFVVMVPVLALVGWMFFTWAWFALYHRHKRMPHVDGPTWRLRVLAWGSESWAIAHLAWWNVYRFVPQARLAGELPPVICVHGFTQNASNFVGISRVLREGGRGAISVDLGRIGRHPTRYSEPFVKALEHVREHYPDQKLDIVCHSMGGVVLRQILHDRGDLALRVGTVVTLGTPHHGTGSTRGLKLLPEVRGMRRSSRWIAGLPSLVESLPHARIVTVGATADYVVYPLDTCHVEGADRVDIQGTGHGGLLTHWQVFQLVRAVLCGGSVSPGDAATPPL